MTDPKMHYLRVLLNPIVALSMALLAPRAFAGTPLPYDGLMPPPGLTVVQLYDSYSSASSYVTASGTHEGQTSLRVHAQTLRLIHTFGTPGGLIWGLQLIQPYVSFPGTSSVNGVDLTRHDGLAEPQISAFIKPYSNPATDSVLTFVYYISPPSGSFSSSAALNASTNNWVNNLEVGYTHMLWGTSKARRMDLEVWGDIYEYGSTDGASYGPIQGVRHTDRSEQLLVYLPYYIHPQSNGYVGLTLEKTWGGAQSIDGAVHLASGKLLQMPSVDTGSRIDFTRVGLVGGTFLTHTWALQALLSTDVRVRGGVRNDVNFELQVMKAF